MWEELESAIDAIKTAEFEPSKDLVNGQFLLTPEQYDQIIAEYGEPKYHQSVTPKGMPGIPVTVIHPDRPAKNLGAGYSAININGTIYAFKPDDLRGIAQ